MDLGAILEVAIGIIFVWIVLSLTTIQIQEWITTRLDKRAKDMESAIQEMLANPNLKAQFYDHPVIRGLTANKRKSPSRIPAWFYKTPILRGFTKEKRKLPSYIPAQQFAAAMFDIAMTANTESSIIQQGILGIRDDLKNSRKLTVQQAVIDELNLLAELARSAAATEAGTAITNRTKEMLKQKSESFLEDFAKKYPNIKLNDEVLHKIMKGLDNTLKQAPDLKNAMQSVVAQQPPINPDDSALSKVRHGVAALSVISPEVNQTLNALLMNVEDYAGAKERQLAQARQSLETWFNDSMDRVSGVFKRYSQRMALIIGFIVALVLNVDSINLTLFLWRDSSVRQVLVAQASQLADQPQVTPSNTQATASDPVKIAQDAQKQLEELNLPVGWSFSAREANKCELFPNTKDAAFGIPFPGSKCLSASHTNDQSNLLTKLVGIFITALAAMQGAPFWFDMLKRVVNLRGTGPKPAESK